MLNPFSKQNINYIQAILHDVWHSQSKLTHSAPKQHKIRKHHWFLGSLVILIGSWITHTTTATIPNETNQQQLGFALLLPNDPTQASSSSIHSIDSLISVTPVTPLKAPSTTQLTHTIKKGETLGLIFKKLGFDLSLPYAISQHEIAKQLVSLSIGKQLTFQLSQDDELLEINYPSNALQNLSVKLKAGQIVDASIIDLPFKMRQHKVSAEITSSLYESALDAGLTINLVMEMVRIFGWDIDFVQDIRSGDTFHVIYDDYIHNGQKLADGSILAASFTTQGNTFHAIRFEDEQGNASYYTPEGNSMLGTFLRSPVEFSRISSRFGKRKHPILKTWRAHKGVDYAASTGTPIRATADGKVIHAGNKGGYGRTAILRHAGRFTTLYGHMNGFAKGIRSGVNVKQGDIIGYVGSTGLATGPHLHYEFRVDGVHRNPLTYKTPKASSIAAESLPQFNQQSQQWLAKLNKIALSYQLAKVDPAVDSTESAQL